MTYLLDVNVLLALFDPVHEHHERAHLWFEGKRNWASCAITELGFLRISANPAYPGRLGEIHDLSKMFQEFCKSSSHVYWEKMPSIYNHRGVQWKEIESHRHLTDLYLLSLAQMNKGKLATFDRKMKVSLLKQGSQVVEWIEG